jgi:hypothetical protein
MSKLNWSFKVNFVGEDHILVSHKKQDADTWTDMLLTVREYAEFMQLLQEFNIGFRDQIDQKLLESYFNE